MIGLDTNVLLRYLVKDDPRQTAKASAILESTVRSDTGFVSLVTIVETVWVLESFYHFSRQELSQAVETILRIDSLFVQNEREVFSALALLEQGRGSFSDALVGALGTWSGCTKTVTFDRKASRLPGFELIA
jgi:predicted nucleic-acid-binding protein